MRRLVTERMRDRAQSVSGSDAATPSVGVAGRAPLIPAAVLVPLIDHPSGMTVLLTRRAAHLKDHAGQVSFPGGRVEEHDAGPVAAALREAQEEIGLAPCWVEVVGCLDNYETVTGFVVRPVVGVVAPGFVLTPDSFEVAEVFELPLELALDTANYRREQRRYAGQTREYYVLDYGPHYVWGATAGILVDLSRILTGG